MVRRFTAVELELRKIVFFPDCLWWGFNGLNSPPTVQNAFICFFSNLLRRRRCFFSFLTKILFYAVKNISTSIVLPCLWHGFMRSNSPGFCICRHPPENLRRTCRGVHFSRGNCMKDSSPPLNSSTHQFSSVQHEIKFQFSGKLQIRLFIICIWSPSFFWYLSCQIWHYRLLIEK